MKMKYIYLFAVLLSLLSFSTCKKDNGNYDYQEIADLRIDTTGLPGPFTVKQSIQELVITPKIVYSGDKTLDYYWIYGETGNDTLSREKDLKSTVNWKIVPTAHNLILQVVERETGRMAAVKYNIYVTGYTGLGLIAAHEKDGTADLDLINLTEANTVLRNIHQTVNGSRLAGKVTGIGTIGENNLYMFMTDQAVSMMRADGMIRQFQDQEVFGQLNAAALKPQAFAFQAGNVNYFVNDGQVYQNFVQNFAPGIMTQKVAMADGSPYRVSPHIILTTSKGGAFYDELGKRMLQMGTNSSNTFALHLRENDPSARFSFDHIDRNFLFGRKGFQLYTNFLQTLTNSTVYCFFADRGGNGRYVYVMGMESPAQPSFGLIDVTAAPDIQQAKFYEVSESTPAVYYADAGKLHLLNLNPGSNFYGDGGVQFTAAPGEEITSVKLERFGAFAAWYFYVATYNAATAEGKVYQHSVAAGTGQISATAVKTWTGFAGRVTKMELKRY